ncbi:MAG TPA: VCBS repeat-containing protein, partial [Tepidisphaeraceae bacterium]|nr:VCBS repeat-containing protein [Tepidisphaeraceae bacterium]
MGVRAAGLKRRNASATKSHIETLESRLLLSTVSLSKPLTSSISTTGPASQVLVGDLNGDGIPDLVTGSAGTAAVLGGFTAQVFLGASSGSFKPGNIVPTGGRAIALGDFNGDGKLDLATAAGVLPGNGNGGFGAAISGFTLPANTVPVSFFTGDFNGDSKLDLAMVTFTSASGASPAKIGLGILIGNGNGTFQSAVTTTVASGTNLNQSEAVFATGDFNGDGNLDVVSPFGVLLGNGKGGFTAPSSGLPVASTPVSSAFAVGDFNGDGKLDLAMVPPGTAAGQIAILPGNGNGTFATPASVVVNAGGGTVTALAAADVDGDGKLDLIAATTQNGNSPAINILTGNGNNTFTAAQSLTPSAIPVALFTADFNGDKALDLLSV